MVEPLESVPAAPRAPAPAGARARLAALRAALPAVLGAVALRIGCYAAMTAAAVWNELRPAPTLPDLVLSHLPYVPLVARWNYVLWLSFYVPVAGLLLWSAPRTFVRYMVTGALVSLARGATLLVTGLGVPDPVHAGPGLAGHDPLRAWLALVSPWQVFARDAMAAYLTKDLFFSGHTATTFLLVLYARGRPRLQAVALAGHALVVASVFLAHLHYTIDVLGAYAVTYAIYVLRERSGPGAGSASPRFGGVRSGSSGGI